MKVTRFRSEAERMAYCKELDKKRLRHAECEDTEDYEDEGTVTYYIVIEED